MRIDYVIGQSWGGYLGFSNALEQPKGFKGFVNADGIASWAKFSASLCLYILLPAQ